ncbi:MAG: glycoside hydrolase family 3 N-terminal domain-containing protein [Clostridium celatum]|nr:glycoside hydrolase family 3 N-terminal domain-containing protein [Clostridium celatum]
MSLREKIGQLFCLQGEVKTEEEIKKLISEYAPGGIMYRAMKKDEIYNIHKSLQENSKIPLLISANLETGGNGIVDEGTFYGTQLQVAASDDEEMAYKLGIIAGREGSAVGCNWSFAPVVDINMNFRNPITNTRSFGSDPERIIRMAKGYMKGIGESEVAVSIKHFPGDGVDDRDHHVLKSVNSLSVEKWDNTFGKIYGELIEDGVQTIMVGHMMLPQYTRKLCPGIEDKDIKPASLSHEIVNGLLREKLNFNGMIVTDATPMAGFNQHVNRASAIPMSIAAGCDMILFTRDLEEDFNSLLKGIEEGIVTEERLNEAVTRILATKASINLHKKKVSNALMKNKEDSSVLRCEEHETWARELADKSITLVKDIQNLLPINSDKYKNILLFSMGETLSDDNAKFKEFKIKLVENGFNVDIYNRDDFFGNFKFFGTSVEDIKKKYDLVIYFANIAPGSNKTNLRINFALPMGFDAPWFINELPTMFISIANPYHLQDVPNIRTFINGYSPNQYVIESIIEKILGKSKFKGINPIDPFCGYWDARL